jgi:hypothetical protein
MASSSAMAALDVVCKADVDCRVQEQKKLIVKLQKDLVLKEKKIHDLQHGKGLTMSRVWKGLGETCPQYSDWCEGMYDDKRTLLTFLCDIKHKSDALFTLATQISAEVPIENLSDLEEESVTESDA